MGTLMTRIEDTRMNLQNRSGELFTQTREVGAGLLTAAQDESHEWRTYLLGRRFVLERELRALSSPTSLERRALELAAESLEAAKARIETRLVELRAMEAAAKRAQAKKLHLKKRVSAKKPDGSAAHAKSKSAQAKTRTPKHIDFPAPN